MSIASEIQRIKNNIANAYTKCRNKGATIPTTQNCANLENCINSIPIGINPTGTLNITGNGTVDVTNYAQASVNVSGGQNTKFGATVDTFLGEVDSNGTLDLPRSRKYLIFNGVKRIKEAALTYRFAVYNSGIYGIYNVMGVSFPDLEVIDSYNALERSFYAQDNLQEVLMPKLVTVPNNNCFKEAFAYCTDLKRVEMPSLVNIPQGTYGSGFYRAFFCTGIENLDLRNLTSIAGYQTFYSAFAICTSLTNLNMPNLTSVTGESACYRMFERCGLTTFTFEKLSTVTGSNALSYMFYDSPHLTSLYFPELTPNSFGSYNNQFAGMLNGVNGCTVHFPIKIKKTIQNWSDVTNGFRGTNTVILFDLKAVTLNFTCNSNTTQIFIDNDVVENNTIDIPAEDTVYIAYDSPSNTVLLNSVTNLSDNEIRNINLDLTQNKQKITLTTGKTGLEVNFNINGISIPAVEETTGNYVINYIGNTNEELSYFINGGNDYTDAEGSITTNGNNITRTVSLLNATVRTFTRPNLTSNGTLGGDSFAVSGTGTVGSNQPYVTMDSDTSTNKYWWVSLSAGTNSEFVFYNPKPLKIESLVIGYQSNSTTWQASTIVVQGSNDNEIWTDLATSNYVSGISRTINVNSSRFFKYHRLLLKVYYCYLGITDIRVNAQYKE